MACEVCQHCMSPVAVAEARICGDNSYHEECHKCYVCSETDLHNAEVFKGVIFCVGCAKRIFQGCSSARRAKSRPRRRARRRRSDEQGVIERARLARSSTRNVLERASHRSGKAEPTELRPVSVDCYCVLDMLGRAQGLMRSLYFQSPLCLKRASVECGVTTDVTQEFFTKMVESVVIKSFVPGKSAGLVRPKVSSRPTSSSKKKETPCSDLRIAELGASTEIATMGLRKHSGTTFNKSESHIRATSKLTRSSSVSDLSQVSDVSDEDSNVEWLDSECNEYRGMSHSNGYILNRHIGSLVKLPYKLLKKNILMKSSLISAIMSTESERDSFCRRFKMLFHDEVVEHQDRGVKRLYSTINRRKTPYRMGWLEITRDMPRASRTTSGECVHLKKVCKHFHTSHSYRCMRAHVMRLAGPTRSEMNNFRTKVKNTIVPLSLIRKIRRLKHSKNAAKMSAACGSELVWLRKTSGSDRSM